jgi:hypothetical protein
VRKEGNRVPLGAEEWGFPTCRECGYSWETSPAEARETIASAPEQFAALLEGHKDAKTKPGPNTWSASGYVWHLSDWLRIQGGRIYGIRHDPDYEPVPLDPDDIDAVFHYDLLSTPAGLWMLKQCAQIFLTATENLDPRLTFQHPVLGEVAVADVVRYVGHEVPHHLMDCEKALGPSRS